MSKFDFMEAAIDDIHKAILAKVISSRDLVEFYLNRIDSYDKQGPSLNSIILINPRAREEADKLDEDFKKTGKLSGPLHGIPVLLKDNVDAYGMPTTAGSLSLEGNIPECDSFITAKLRQSGAIILAKTNLHEFAIWGETVSSILGQTLNPYDLSRTPGGSSGGTGAGIAANFGVIGIGTDSVNSIRSPASANCLVGIRPTLGMVSRSGIVPYSHTQDTAGPICRTVKDAVLTLDAIAAYDSADAETARSAGLIPDKGYAAFLKKDGLKGKRIGILESFFGKEEINTEVNMLTRKAIDICSQNGSEIISLDESLESPWLVSNVSVHMDEFKDHLNSYLQKLAPNAKVHSLEEIMACGLYHPSIKANLDTAMTLSTKTPEYNKKLVLKTEAQIRVMKLMIDNGLDAIVFPHQQQLVCKVGESQQQRNGVLSSVTGCPSIAVPVGFSAPTIDAPLGVPVGMEIFGRPWSEPLLIEIAYGFEQATQFRKAPIGF